MSSRTNFFAEIVQCFVTEVGYADASDLGCGGVWIDPNEDGFHYIWHLPWPEDIMEDLVSTENPHGRITNFDLEFTALVLQEATFPFVSANPVWQVPFTRSVNTPTVAWTLRGASILNPVVSDLLRLRSLVNHQFKITPSFFYHPGPQKYYGR